MKYTVDTIKEIVKRNPNTPIIYFWGHTVPDGKLTAACLSQWYYCYFQVDGVQYHTTEQYMMAGKARLFGDSKVLAEIMEANNPHDYKKLGRQISGFEQTAWNNNKYDIVVEGNKAKFSQNDDIKEFLLATGDAILAEASPYDKIWGIGLDSEHAKELGVDNWRGQNLLGCALMEVRDWLRGLE